MNRRKKLGINTIATLSYQVITLICGFVLPKFVIPYFGSETNGLINSITQFLTIITLCECGVGAVVQTALYKPLAEGDDHGINNVVIASSKFFNKIILLLGIYVGGLMIFYPLVVNNFSHIYTASLILIIAFSYVAQYYLFLTYRLLLNADQLAFIQLFAHSAALILNTVATIVLIKLGASVHMVKLVSATVFLLQPIVIKICVDKRYNINKKIIPTKDAIPQKWNGIAQHIASVVQQNTPTVVLTLFATLTDVSIYGVYFLIAHGIRQIIVSLNSSIKPMLGNMYAKNEDKTLNDSYSFIEFAFHTVVTLTFTMTGILLIPFIRIYTVNFTDANYIQPFFGVLMVLAQACFCLRTPYEMMIQVAGHYKQTQTSSFIEAGISIGVSILLVFPLGLTGVAIGIFCSMLYRTIYLVWYLSKNIIYRRMGIFVKHMLVNLLCVGLLIAILCLFPDFFQMKTVSYFGWFILALKTGVVFVLESAVINLIFYRDIALKSIGILFKKLFKKKAA